MALQPLPFQSFHSLQGSPYIVLFASLTRYRTMLHVFENKSQKTLRTKRSLEEFYFFETILSLGLQQAIRATKYEMLFEHSEFIECFEKIGFRPLRQRSALPLATEGTQERF